MCNKAFIFISWRYKLQVDWCIVGSSCIVRKFQSYLDILSCKTCGDTCNWETFEDKFESCCTHTRHFVHCGSLQHALYSTCFVSLTNVVIFKCESVSGVKACKCIQYKKDSTSNCLGFLFPCCSCWFMLNIFLLSK